MQNPLPHKLIRYLSFTNRVEFAFVQRIHFVMMFVKPMFGESTTCPQLFLKANMHPSMGTRTRQSTENCVDITAKETIQNKGHADICRPTVDS